MLLELESERLEFVLVTPVFPLVSIREGVVGKGIFEGVVFPIIGEEISDLMLLLLLLVVLEEEEGLSLSLVLSVSLSSEEEEDDDPVNKFVWDLRTRVNMLAAMMIKQRKGDRR